MRSLSARRSRVIVALCSFTVALSLVACLTALPAAVAQPAPKHYAQVLKACPAPAPGNATCFALVRKPVASPAPGKAPSAGAQPFVVGGGAASVGPAGGLTPEDLASAYGYSPTATGAGQTVGIVDAFDDSAIESDLGEFDTHYGLPACTTASGCFKKVGQTGSSSSLPAADTSGWSVEIALDVETVHAACPNCRILLVEGNDPSFANLAAAVNEAVVLGATVVSNSYGGHESGPGSTERAAYNHAGVPIVASTGDDGYYGWDWVNEFGPFEGEEMPNFPASLASTVAVGGTTLKLEPDGSRANETVWNNNGPGDAIGEEELRREGATGGGCSKLFTAQPWQHAVAGFAATGCGTTRLDADVSAVADPLTGLDIYDTYNCGAACTGLDVGWETIGGTSLSAPFVSSLYGLAGGGNGVSDPALTLYGHATDASLRFDVEKGGNGFCGGESTAECVKPNSTLGEVDCEGTTACNAVAGFDGPSGIGTPKGLGLFKPLLPTAVISPPGSLIAGTAASFSAGASSDPYPGGSITGALWDFGDGTTGAGVSASHVYGAPGTDTVTLTVSDAYGLSSNAVGASVSVGASPGGGGGGGSTTTATTATVAVVPNSAFPTAHAALNAKTGAIKFTTSVLDPGTFSWLATFQNGKFGAFASASKCKTGFVKLAGKCLPAKIVFAKGSKLVGAPGSVSVTLKPSASALKALKKARRQKKGLPVTIVFSFKSSLGGSAVSHTQSVTVRLEK